MPALERLQSTYGDRGLQVLGIALDEADMVRAYGDEMGINYPSLLALEQGPALMAGLGGSGALPFSAIVDRTGRVVETRLGVYEAEELDAAVTALID